MHYDVNIKLYIEKGKKESKRMTDKKVLLDNIDKIHTTELGVERIKRNLKLGTIDVVEYCKSKVANKNCRIYQQGKNWYCEIDDIKITINAHSYTIITAHMDNNTHPQLTAK